MQAMSKLVIKLLHLFYVIWVKQKKGKKKFGVTLKE